MSKLVRRGSIYYFRTRIPKDLRNYFDFRAEVRKSLQTGIFRIAKARAAQFNADTEQTFCLLRSRMLTDEQATKLAACYMDALLSGMEQHRSNGSNLCDIANSGIVDGYAFQSDFGALNDSFPVRRKTVAGLEKAVAHYTHKIEFLKQCLALDEYDMDLRWRVYKTMQSENTECELPPEEYLNPNDGAWFAPPPVGFRIACRAFLKAEINAYRVEVERLRGNYNNEYDSSLSQYRKIAEEPIPEPEKTLKDVVDEYVSECTGGNCWTAKTEAENRAILELILELIPPETPVKTLTHKDMLKLRDDLAALPPNRSKIKAYRGKTARQLVEMKVDKPISTSTLNKYLTRASSLFKHAEKHGYTPRNIAAELCVKNPKSDAEYREMFTPEDIAKIKQSLPKDQKHPERYWIPLVGMYSGMRLNEICQLHMDDAVIDDVPYFDVNDSGDKHLKNKASKRKVPIHPWLIEAGFLDFVETRKKSGAKLLWPNIKKGRDGYANLYGKWFQRFNREYITDNPKKVFHSFRHTVATRLKYAEVDPITIAEILGHSGGSDIFRRYAKKHVTDTLSVALRRLNYED